MPNKRKKGKGLIGFFATPEERKQLRKLAKDRGLSVSELLRRRIIPIHENLRHWMERAEIPRSGPILSAGTSVLYREVRRVSGRVLGKKKWPRNSLRHSYATYRMALTRDASRVSEELGNSPGIVRRHYDQVATPQEGAAWFQIEPD